MNAKFFMISAFCVVFSTLNCMEQAGVNLEEGRAFKFEDYYKLTDRSLNLSERNITDSKLDDRFEDLLRFINKNKVEILLLDSNKFSPDRESVNEILRKVKILLEHCTSLMTISLRNNFKQESVERGVFLSPEIISALISSLGQLKNLFEGSSTNAVTKHIILGDDNTTDYSAKLPPTIWQRVKANPGYYAMNVASIVISTGLTILVYYLTDKSCSGSN